MLSEYRSAFPNPVGLSTASICPEMACHEGGLRMACAGQVGVQDNQILPGGPEQVPGWGCFWHVLGQLSSTGWECLGERASWLE